MPIFQLINTGPVKFHVPDPVDYLLTVLHSSCSHRE